MKYTDYQVTLELTEPMLGTVPKNPKVYEEYIASKAPSLQAGNEEVEVEKSREDIEKGGWTGFHHDDQGLFLYDYQIMGFLKEAGNTLKEQLGIKNLRSKIEQFVFVLPRRIHFAQKPCDEPLERPLRAMTMQGPRVTLTRSDMVPTGTKIEFTIRLLDNWKTDKGDDGNGKKRVPEISADTLKEILGFGGLKGLGQWRNGGYGRFEVVSMKPVTKDTKEDAAS